MNLFLKTVSYILHPIIMPLLGAIIYFTAAPRFIAETIIKVKTIELVIITILIPIVFSFFLKNMQISVPLQPYKRRKILLLLQSVLLIVVIKIIIDIYNYPELYFFFLGILFSILTTIFMMLFKIKTSLHMIGISAITMFTVSLSIHFGMNLILLISLLMVSNGLVATAMLHCKTNTSVELILGIIVGVTPQITLINLWL